MTTVVLVQQGGTGANNAADARAALGAAPTAAYDQANSAFAQANLAYAAANNSNLKSGGLISGTLNVTNDMIVGGNIYLQGNTTFINVATYQVNDPLMYIAANNILTDSVDIGFIGAKNTSGTFSHTGLARDATDGKYKLFDGLPDNDHIGNVINFANTYLATLVANVEANTLSVVNGVSGNVNFDSGTLFIDSVGNEVGIGTTNPGMPLEVFTGNSSLGIRIKRFAGNYYSDIVHTDTPEGLAFNVGDGTTVTEKMRITGAGNIGIGTSSPTDFGGRNLSIHSPSSSTYASQLWVSGAYVMEALVNEGSSVMSFGSRSNHKFELCTNDTTRMTISNTGDVGIGTTAPDSKLAVYSATGNTQIRFGASSNYYWDISRDNDVTGSLWISNYNAVGSRTNRLVISPDGNIGIGTSSPATKLHVSAGAIRLDNGYSFTWAGTGGWNGSTTGSQFFKFTDNNQYYDVYDGAHIFRRASYAESMRITSAGDIGIGTASPSTKLDVNGTITCTALTETSSIIFKENVDPIIDALNSITKLVGVTYDRKDGSAKQKAGLIAEEVEKVLPNLVQKDNDGNAYGIHYTNLIAYLVESIKELKQEIDSLKSK